MADYVIQHGDNLSRIARTHCTDVKTLMKLNPQIKNQNLIFANDTIKLPEAKMDTFTREVPQEQQGNEPTAHIPQEQAQENPAALPHGEETPATTAEEIQTPQQETQQQASLTGNPFLYAAGGAAAGVIGMRLAEKLLLTLKKVPL